MGKYDSPRKSLPGRQAATAASKLNYLPTVSRAALDEDAWREARRSLPAAAPAVVPVGTMADAFASLEGDDEQDDALPLPEMGVPKETRVVERRATPPTGHQPSSARTPVDPMAMLEAATIWGCSKPRE